MADKATTVTPQFTAAAYKNFKKLDANRNGFLSSKELAAPTKPLDVDGQAAAATLRDSVDFLQGLSDDEKGAEDAGVTRKDLATFARMHAKGNDGAAKVENEFTATRARVNDTAKALLAEQQAKNVPGKPVIATKYYNNLEGLKKELNIEYGKDKVTVSYPKSGLEGANELSKDTLGQKKLKAAASGDLMDKIGLGLEHPGVAWNSSEIESVEKLSYVAKNPTGTALGRVTSKMFENIENKPKLETYFKKSAKSEFGLTNHDGIKNTFLHVFGQAVITSLWDRDVADKVGDIHERDQEALITGKVGKGEQWQATDNYSDMVNNVYGQNLGEKLNAELGIDSDTVWTDELTAKYMNRVQEDFSGDLGFKFKPFDQNSDDVKKFRKLLNHVKGNE